MSRTLIMPAKVLGHIINNALLRMPEECCGLLVGSMDEVSYARQIDNVHGADRTTGYTMNARQLAVAEIDAKKRGLGTVAYYHSHPFSEATPSTTDINKAVENGHTSPIYVVVSLQDRLNPSVRAFKINEVTKVDEVQIVVTTSHA